VQAIRAVSEDIWHDRHNRYTLIASFDEGIAMKRYSEDLRVRIVEARETGSTQREIAEQFTVSYSLVRQLLTEVRRNGCLTPPVPRPGRPRKLAEYEGAIADAVRAQCDLTLEELRTKLNLPASLATVHATIQRMNLTFKKKRSARPNASVRT